MSRMSLEMPTGRGLRSALWGLFGCLSVTAALAQAPSGPTVGIHVLSHGWHAGLVLPAAPLNAMVPGLSQRFPQAQAYEVGWGDMGFYQAQQASVGLALQALFASKGSLLHVVGLSSGADMVARGADAAHGCVSQAQLQAMVQRIAGAFEPGPEGLPVPKGPGLYGDSQFYLARGTYSWRHTCNRWSAEVLQAGGLPITAWWRLTAGSVLSAVRSHGHPNACADSGP